MEYVFYCFYTGLRVLFDRYRPSLQGEAEIIIGKQRNGPVGSVPLMWNAESESFENAAPGFRISEEELNQP